MSLSREELLARFRDEACGRLDTIVDGLLEAEKGTAGPGTLDLLFREAHSIKGSSGMMGLDDAYSLAHEIEDVLADARERGSLSGERIEPLLRAVDALRDAVTGRRPPPPDVAAREVGPVGGRDAESRNEPRALRVAAEKVDRLFDAVGETVLHQRRLDHLLRHGGAAARDRATEDELDRGRLLLDEVQESVIELRTVPLGSITAPLPRAVRDLAAADGKEVELEIAGADTELDRAVLDAVSDSIAHLVRNAVAHGIEPPAEREREGKPRRGRVELAADQRGDRVALTVRDDGRGVAADLIARSRGADSLADVLAEAGLSTAETVTEVAGRGVGLDTVKRRAESVGGSMSIASEPGRGTAVTLTLPLSLTLLDALLLERAGSVFGIPLADVAEVATATGAMTLGGRQSLAVRGEPIPAGDVAAVLGGQPPALEARAAAVVVASPEGRAALLCDRVLGEEELVVKGLGPLLAGAPGYVGGSVLGDGRVALVLDSAFLVTRTGRVTAPRTEPREERLPPKVLVVDDQFTVRELQRSILEAAGYRVATAGDALEARERLSQDSDVELVVTDIEMPGMDGLELLARIREDPAHGSLPVVIVSSRGSPEDERRGLEAGADAYLGKERFDQDALLATVARLVGR